jgi:hypothetical protein
MNNHILKTAGFSMLTAILVICYACAAHRSLARVHPVAFTTAPLCSNCHTDDLAAFSHTSDFNIRHKFLASRKQQVCNLCHQESFCSDCHANKEELKPSDKFKDSPQRFLPHRGDYLTQHRIDGRINPAPCLKCHGRNNNARCRACHK